MFDNNITGHQPLVECDQGIAPTFKADGSITVLQGNNQIVVTLDGALLESNAKSFFVLLVRQFRKRNALRFLLAFIAKNQFGQGVLIDAECKRLKVLVTDMHGFYLTDVGIRLALCHLQDSLCLVV